MLATYLVHLEKRKMLLIDKYAYTNRLSNANPNLKLMTVAICLIIATVISNNYINIFIFFFMTFLTVFIAGIPLNKYLKILYIPLGFLILSIMTILFSISSENIYILSLKISNNYIGITKLSILESINIITRVLASISSTFFLALTTPINSIIKVLKKIKVSNTLIELFVLIYRSIFIFLEESIEIYNAQEMRFGYSSFKKSLNSTGLLIKALFVRIFMRYKEMVISLDCKLYNGEFKTGD